MDDAALEAIAKAGFMSMAEHNAVHRDLAYGAEEMDRDWAAESQLRADWIGVTRGILKRYDEWRAAQPPSMN